MKLLAQDDDGTGPEVFAATQKALDVAARAIGIACYESPTIEPLPRSMRSCEVRRV